MYVVSSPLVNKACQKKQIIGERVNIFIELCLGNTENLFEEISKRIKIRVVLLIFANLIFIDLRYSHKIKVLKLSPIALPGAYY